jgi:uncharacterized delta-60 repeat protein
MCDILLNSKIDMLKALHHYARSVALFATLLAPFQGLSQGVTLQLANASIRVNEASAHTVVSLTRSGDTNVVVDVGFKTTEGAASANSDFIPAKGTLSFAPGETNKTVSIDLLEDLQTEADEQFQVEFTAPADVQWAGESKATITIEDNDRPGGVDASLNFSESDLPFGVHKIAIGTQGRFAAAGTNAQGVLNDLYLQTNGLYYGQSFYPDEQVRGLVFDERGAVLVCGTFRYGDKPLQRRYLFPNRDYSFASASAITGIVNQVILGPEHTLFAAGNFRIGTNASPVAIAKFTETGDPINDFNAPSLQTNEVTALALAEEKLYAAYTVTREQSQTFALARVALDGSLDETFPVVAADGRIEKILPHPAGGFLVVGAFSQIEGQQAKGFARISADGSLDSSFLNPAADGQIAAAALQWNGKIVIAGTFSAINGKPRSKIARLNPDGSLDDAFDPGTGPDGNIFDVAAEPEGTILVGGDFQQFSGLKRNGLVRLNGDEASGQTAFFWKREEFFGSEKLGYADATIVRRGDTSEKGLVHVRTSPLTAGVVDFVSFDEDVSFEPGESEKSVRFSILNDAEIEGPEKFQLQLTTDTPNAIIPRGEALMRILDDEMYGTLDPSFVAALPGNGLGTFAVQPDGKILFSYGAEVWRLNYDGSLDLSFKAQMPKFDPVASTILSVNSLAPAADGKIYVGGAFATSRSYGTNYILRLNADGSYDPSFYAGFSGSRGRISIPTITIIAPQPDGSLYAGGELEFRTQSGVNWIYNGLVRLKSSGILDNTFKPGISNNIVYSDITVLENGQILAAGDFRGIPFGTNFIRTGVLRLNSSGSLDTNFTSSISSAYAVFVQGKQYLVGGSFTEEPRYFARLNSDGTADPSFPTKVNGPVKGIKALSNGKIIIWGNFTSVNDIRRCNIARLNADGTLDPKFEVVNGFDISLYKVAEQIDGNLLCGGWFYHVDDMPAKGLVRLIGADPTPGELRFNATGYETVEGSEITIYVNRAGGSVGAIDARVQTGDLSAIAGQSYEPLDATIHFDDGEISARKFVIKTTHNPALQGPLSFEAIITIGSGADATRTVVPIVIKDAEAGLLDTAFLLHLEPADALIRSFALAPDGAVLVAGNFTSINGVASPYAAKVNADGSVDETFLQGLVPNRAVNEVVFDPEGNILLGGSFTSIGSTASRWIAKISPGMNLDLPFVTNVNKVSLSIAEIISMTPQSEGRIFVRRAYDGFRLNSDGTKERSFNNIGGNAMLPNFDGGYFFGSSDLLKYAADGSSDPSFSKVTTLWPGSASGYIHAIAPALDNKILVGGNFTRLDGVPRSRAALITSEGQVDLSFDPLDIGPYDFNVIVSALHQLPDKDILIGGNFSTIQGSTRTRLARLAPAGKLREDFSWNIQGNGVTRIDHDPAGAIYILGSFTNVNGSAVPGFARILNTLNKSPIVEIASPTNRANVESGKDLRVEVQAFDPDGFFPPVRLFVNGSSVATSSVAPYSFILTNLVEGQLTITAEATDLLGLTTTSLPVEITVKKPLNNEPVTIAQPQLGSDGKLRIVFGGQQSASYRLEESEDLLAWSTVETLEASDASIQFEVDSRQAPHRFFRVVQER